jgi:predicted transcriptional regulator of viral defense system
VPAVSQKRSPPRDRIIQLAKAKAILRPQDLKDIGVPREYLRRMRDEGVLEQPARGLYVLTSAKPTEHQTLVEVCKRVPQGVVCLLSALQFHGLTTQLPREVWIALGTKAWAPKLDYPRIRIARFSSTTLTFGVEERRIGGALIRVFKPAKTVADCFKFRNKIGLDVALEALRDCLKQRKATRDEIWNAARICRVANVMRPYLESLA